MLTQRAIYERSKRGVTGPELYKPRNPGHFKIDEKKAKAIWADIQKLCNGQRQKFNVLQHIADKHGANLGIVKNIKYGSAWNHVTGLPRKHYESDY